MGTEFVNDGDPLRPHRHDPNLETPEGDGSFVLATPDGVERRVTVDDLRALPQTAVANCFIVSTGHGTTGPFTFDGVTLAAFVAAVWHGRFDDVEVVSVDGFGNRVLADELLTPDPAGPILLAVGRDGRPLTREQGLVRLIVPSETDDALRQVKWVGAVRIVARP